MGDKLKVVMNEIMTELEENERRPITMFITFTGHMVASKAESCKATEEWVRNFSILNFDGENVTNVITHCKAAV